MTDTTMTDTAAPQARTALAGVLALALLAALPAQAQEPPATAADLVAGESTLPLLRLAAQGTGAFPYRLAVPEAGVRATLDGVPLASRSPLGLDLEGVPACFVDSVAVRGDRIAMRSRIPLPAEPVTDTRFLTGVRGRFGMDVVFARALGDSTAFLLGGSSAGVQERTIAGRDNFIPRDSRRSYRAAWRRDLERGGTLIASVSALRDREGLADLDSLQYLGERKLDDLTLSLGARDLALGPNTTADPVIYYTRSSARYSRYGLKKSLEDDVIGAALTVEKKLGDTSYRLAGRHETELFDSRIHGEDWVRSQSEAGGGFGWRGGPLRFDVDGRANYHSEYGFGVTVEGDAALALGGRWELLAAASGGSVYPDVGDEYHAALLFGDTARIDRLERGSAYEISAGIGALLPGGRAELTGFASRADVPVFLPPGVLDAGDGAMVRMADGLESAGGKLVTESAFGAFERLAFTLRTQTAYRYDRDAERRMFPALTSIADGSVETALFDGNLVIRGTGRAGAYWWEREGLAAPGLYPDGVKFLVDAQVTVRVRSLEMYYRGENLTGADIRWLGVLDWQGRNTMYGGRWIFYQ